MDTSEPRCARCRRPLREGDARCTYCGHAVGVVPVCRGCGRALRQREFHKCLYCGVPIRDVDRMSDAEVRAALDARDRRYEERRARERAVEDARKARAAASRSGRRVRHDAASGTIEYDIDRDSDEAGE